MSRLCTHDDRTGSRVQCSAVQCSVELTCVDVGDSFFVYGGGSLEKGGGVKK